MSTYRRPPPPPRWRLLYRLPLLDRFGRSATVFAAIMLLSLLTMIVAPLLGGIAMLPIAAFGLMAAFTAAAFLTIAWMTRLPTTAECTIAQLSGDEQRPSRCLVVSDSEQWTLPVSAEDLRVGQKIRVSFREIALPTDLEPEREVIEVRAVED
jgi:hypothetical protein